MEKTRRASKTPSERKDNHSSKSENASHPKVKAATIEEQENEDLEVEEGLEDGIPEQPGNVPRF